MRCDAQPRPQDPAEVGGEGAERSPGAGGVSQPPQARRCAQLRARLPAAHGLLPVAKRCLLARRRAEGLDEGDIGERKRRQAAGGEAEQARGEGEGEGEGEGASSDGDAADGAEVGATGAATELEEGAFWRGERKAEAEPSAEEQMDKFFADLFF